MYKTLAAYVTAIMSFLVLGASSTYAATETIWGTSTPAITGAESISLELGTVFSTNIDGSINGVRIYAVNKESGNHVVRIWNNVTGSVVKGPISFKASGTGWRTYTFATPLAIKSGTSYTVSITTGTDASKRYAYRENAITEAGSNGQHILYPANAGVFTQTLGLRPTQTYRSANYYRDVVFAPSSQAVPTASITANPISVVPGASSTISWSSVNAVSCVGTGFSTNNAVSGSMAVTPTETTTYTVSCTGSGGTASGSVTVTVTDSSIPQPEPIVNVRSYGATGNGTTDDGTSIRNAVTAVRNAGHGTLYFPSGTYRNALAGDGVVFNGISNVTIAFEPGAVLLMDNLRSGAGNGHGVVFRGHASDIYLNNVNVTWKTLPSTRSYGDGIRFDGFPSNDRTLSNINIINPTVQRAPQAGIILMGISDVSVKNALVKDTLADGLHVNASRRVNIDTYRGENTGDDGLAFVTYYDPSSVYAYPGTNEGPYAQPSLGEWSNTDSTVSGISISGGGANGMRINAASRVNITNLMAENKGGVGLFMDATEGNGTTLGWTVEASRDITVDGITATNCAYGVGVIHQGGDGFNSNSRFWDFSGTSISNVNINNNRIWGVLLDHVANVNVNHVTGSDADNIGVSSDCRNCVVNVN